MSVLLTKWHQIKQQIKELEQEESELRNKVEKFMEARNVDQFRSGNFRVSRKKMSRSTLSKKNCPKDVWDKYAKVSNYSVIRIENLGNEETLE